jgi:hypothetical protein
MPKLNVEKREQEIYRYLVENASKRDGASASELHARITSKLGDTVTRQAYYKILDRMVVTGKIEVLREETERGRIYGIAPTLNSANPITLDDIYEMLPFMATTETLARLVDAQDYYQENINTVLRQAAEALQHEDPVELFFSMLTEMIDTYNSSLAIHNNQELTDKSTRGRVEAEYKDLETVAYRYLSLPRNALRLPSFQLLKRTGLDDQNSEDPRQVTYDPDQLRKALRSRIFGETFICEIDVSANRGTRGRMQLNVAGSDGSMHAGTLALQSAGAYVGDLGDVITFNNSIVSVRLSPDLESQEGVSYMTHSAPFTRQTIDDPSYKGMVLTKAMFPDLADSEYEHMVRSATDVMQFRVDEEVFSGKARDLRPPYRQIPKPQVHFRDGTITPQEREFGHYGRNNAYGEVVREGIRRERSILERIIIGRERSPIFAGAVKSTQMRIFGRILNWYIKKGSRARFSAPLDPNWDISRAAHISDNEAMTALMSALPHQEKTEGKYFVTCAVLRQFPSLTEFYNMDLRERTWLQYFEDRKTHALHQHQEWGEDLPYYATVDLADDDFVFMCERADYVSFYIGHTWGDPAPMIPRYEFLTSLRDETETFKSEEQQKAAERVDQAIRRIVDALDAAGFQVDRDHNFLSGKTLTKILPGPVQQAHEESKSLGRKLESELRSIIISRLIEIRKLRAPASDLTVRPMSVRSYLERIAPSLQEDSNDEIR